MMELLGEMTAEESSFLQPAQPGDGYNGDDKHHQKCWFHLQEF